MGLSRYNPTRHIDILRTKEAQAQGFISPPIGYARLPKYCEACNAMIYFAWKRQKICKNCSPAYYLGLHRNPGYAENKKRKRLKDSKLNEYIKKRDKVTAIKRIKRLNALLNKRCICGVKIHHKSNYCRSCAGKKRFHPYKFLICQKEECKNKHVAKGLCNKHYKEIRKLKAMNLNNKSTKS